LILGLHDDSLITSYHGPNYPILSLQERLLNTLGTKYVDEVIIDAPWKVTE
jgi:ethanolamine-phosphate cytidylyltransferase